jgi:predicted nucleotide-binding protein
LATTAIDGSVADLQPTIGVRSMMKPKVFIGSSSGALGTAELVKAELSAVAEVILWNDSNFFGLGAGTLEALVDSLEEFDFAVLLFTPDDPIIHNGQPKLKPRDNVLIEFGLYTGGLGRDRSFAMRSFSESIHIPTDLAGVTVAELKSTGKTDLRYDVKPGCKKIANTIRAKGFRHRAARELGVLYRLVNALTFPHYEDVHVPALQRARINYRNREVFNAVDDVVDFMGGLLTDYVYPHLSFEQIESVRIYFAYYLGEGVASLPNGDNMRACRDKDGHGRQFDGEFIIALANPTEELAEHDWRVGRAVKGFPRGFPQSMCAKVFQTGRRDGFDDVRRLPHGTPNYWTPNELSVFSFPVEWRSDEGAGRIGVLTISSRRENSVSPELKMLLDLVANIVGFLFSIYGVRDRKTLEKEGSSMTSRSGQMWGFSANSDTEDARRFAAAVVGLRRAIAGYFEKIMIAQGKHGIVSDELQVIHAPSETARHPTRGLKRTPDGAAQP